MSKLISIVVGFTAYAALVAIAVGGPYTVLRYCGADADHTFIAVAVWLTVLLFSTGCVLGKKLQEAGETMRTCAQLINHYAKTGNSHRAQEKKHEDTVDC